MIDLVLNSWTLGGVAAVGLLIVGRKKAWGWLLLVGAQCMWITYGVRTGQYGFIASGLGFALLNGHNYRKWARVEKDEESPVIVRLMVEGAGGACSEVVKIPRAEWDAMTPEQRDWYVKGEARRCGLDFISWGGGRYGPDDLTSVYGKVENG